MLNLSFYVLWCCDDIDHVKVWIAILIKSVNT